MEAKVYFETSEGGNKGKPRAISMSVPSKGTDVPSLMLWLRDRVSLEEADRLSEELRNCVEGVTVARGGTDPVGG